MDQRDVRGLLEEWRFDARPVFMVSEFYATLLRELTAYVRGEVRGRSFLVAAHRGVGKTALVRRAVDDLALRITLDAIDEKDRRPPVRRPWPQRPLLVKLHGSALVAPSKSYRGPPTRPSAEATLQQITSALYRELAREIAECFTLHARAKAQQEGGVRKATSSELAELAGQLSLDLDLAPDIAALRSYWERLGRLEHGVLWPGSVGQRMAAEGFADRGVREIVALMTANQAFQVCSGRVEAQQIAKDSAERTAKVEGRGRIDAQNAANKLWGLGAGALVGGALFDALGAPAATATGLGAALLSTFAFGWSGERSRRGERRTDYTFIMDRSLQTLDRDLPLVIERTRDAGLAPVFLIDELDKLEAPGDCVEAIISRLKNLTTDYGFFCFLTDRAYFEEVEAKTGEAAYPKEHTFFSHRLLLVYRPPDLARYVRELVTTDPTQPLELIAAWVLTCLVLHGAQMNMVSVRRELARRCDGDGVPHATPQQLCGLAEFLVPMAIQLAIEHVLRHTEIRPRVADDSAFAQLAVDVLYMISRAWEDGVEEVTVSEATVRADLIRRRRILGDPATAAAKLAAAVSDAEITSLSKRTRDLAELLTSFPTLGAKIVAEYGSTMPTTPAQPPYSSTTDSEGAKLATLAKLLSSIPGTPTGLLDVADQQRPHTFRFKFNRYGVAYVDSFAALRDVHTALALLDDLTAGLATVGLTISQLVEAGVLPPSLAEEGLNESAKVLRGVDDPDVLAQVPGSDLDRITGLLGVPTLRRAIVALVALAGRMAHDASALPYGGRTPAQALTAIDRMLGIGPLVAMLSAAAESPLSQAPLKSQGSAITTMLLGCPESIGSGESRPLREAIAGERERQSNQTVAKPDQDRWRRRIARWLPERARPIEPPIDYTDLVEATAGVPAVAMLRADFDAITVAEWSSLCRVCVSPPWAGPTQTWEFAAGLRALGFGQRVLAATGVADLADGARPDMPGLVLNTNPGHVSEPPNLDSKALPLLSFPKAEQLEYHMVIDWLNRQRAIGVVIQEAD